MLETLLHTKLMFGGGGGRHTHAREEAKFKLKEQLSPVRFRLEKVVSLDLFLAIQAALPTKSFKGQDAKCFKAVLQLQINMI